MKNDSRVTSHESRVTNFKIGIGYDIHRLIEGRKLVLGGVTIPFEKGLLGHSDGDALLHAIADAMLGALAQGDIGQHFPDTDPAFKDANSLELLKKVATLATDKGWKVANVDANIIAQAPKMTPHIESMRRNIADALGVPFENISVKARTNEGLDSIGKGEATATQAVVLMEKT